ncbi:head maturation protease, ClpP-related [Bacillus sp. es.036]|uniref:head maturation protease, ClpP-related n=1 Tax=Bacillus sp. es.036 TaxID=1761764 RepID=UPI000BF2B532|nr:head maturation protease, ClpP-related [Bacillus sp. es.036]PFG13064.1 ATP-dependent protease ClpP protease subunit [Bacillus sp. es.036]
MSKEYKDQIKNMMNKKTDVRFEADEKDKEYSLYIYGPIGGFCFSDNSAQSIRRKLQNVDAEKIHVHINSPGGSAFDGVAIGNILKNHKAEIIVHVDGMAASAASVIAVAGDKVIMPENTMMMIHRASTFEYGNAAVFEKTASDLRKIDASLAASYKKRFVGEQSELEQLLDEETFLTAEEAVAFGLADIVGEEIEIQELEDLDDGEEEEEEYDNLKDKLVAKYSAKKNAHKNESPEPKPTPANKQNMSKLFLNLK